MQFPKRLTAIALMLLAEGAIAPIPALATPSRLSSVDRPSPLTSLSSEPMLLPSETPMEVALQFRSRQWSSLRRLRAPRWSIGGAARGGCTLNESPLVPLMPVTNLTDSYPSFSGVTTDGHPSFFVYVPQTTAQLVEFLLIRDEDGQIAYEPEPQAIDGSRAQIVSFHLDSNLSSLEVDKTYTWYFSLVCNSGTFNRPDMTDNSGSPYVRGVIQRVAPDPGLSSSLATAAPRDRPQVYAAAGIWLDTLTALANLRCTSPNDATLASDWTDLMRSLDLYQIPDLSVRIERDALSRAPLTQCAAQR